MKKLSWFIPLLTFIIVCVFLFKGLHKDTSAPSMFLNKPAPAFSLPLLIDPQKIFTEKELIGEVTVINFWATWCPPCRQEHPVLVEIAKDYKVKMIGINYKDDAQKAQLWLQELENPYQVVLSDTSGKTAIDWGIIAVPETFVVDKEGVVRYKHTGPITLKQWEKEIWPLICTLPNNGFPECLK